jgi:uncharacterized DUF497 family protein
MAFAFEWNPQKAAANERKHEVTFDEAVTAFGDPSAASSMTPGTRSGKPD